MKWMFKISDILVIGKGDWDAPVNTDIIKYLKGKGINTEILPTVSFATKFFFSIYLSASRI